MQTTLRLRHLCFVFVILLLFISAPLAFADDGQVYVLRILHTNDHHAHIEPVQVDNKPVGGVSRRKALLDHWRIVNGDLLVVDAGDVFQGTLYFNRFLGQADLYFYDQMKYDAMAVGNHEFDKGQQVLADFINGSVFPVLSANIVVSTTSPLAHKIKPWVIKEVRGQRIGIFGLTTEETPSLSSPGAGVEFIPVDHAAQRAVADLAAQGVNKVIALTHIGYDEDQRLASGVSGIDVIVGGHSHTPLDGQPGAVGPYPTIVTGPDGNRTVIVQDWEWGQWVGDISIGFDSRGIVTGWMGTPIQVDERFSPDAAFEAKIKEYSAQLNDLLSTKIGVSNVDLDGSRANVRSRETNLGDLIADAMLDKVRPDGGRIALISGGSIRASIRAGDVTVGNVMEVLPFDNTLVRVDLTGAQVKEALENGVSQVEIGAGRFPQVAGIRFSWDPEAPVGSRITGIEVAETEGYRPIDLAATYRLVTTNFAAAGGDGYTVFQSVGNVYNTNFLVSEVVSDYIQAHSPITQEVDGRIVIGSHPAPIMELQPTLP